MNDNGTTHLSIRCWEGNGNEGSRKEFVVIEIGEEIHNDGIEEMLKLIDEDIRTGGYEPENSKFEAIAHTVFLHNTEIKKTPDNDEINDEIN